MGSSSSSEDGPLSSFPAAGILNYLYTIDLRSGVVGARVDFALRSSEIFPVMNALFDVGCGAGPLRTGFVGA